MSSASRLQKIGTVLGKARKAASEYRSLTGKPLGITGEVAEYEAARILRLTLADARQAGFDATRTRNGSLQRIQIKGRRIADDAKPGQRVGSLRFDHGWDFVLLVILDADLEPVAIYEATRQAARKALKAPGSKARNKRGALSVAKFKRIGKLVWSVQFGHAA